MKNYCAALLFLGFLPLCTKAQTASGMANQAFLVTRMIQKFHVEPRPLDNQFSHDLLNQLINLADPDRIYFLQPDLKQLYVYDQLLDDEIAGKKSGFLHLFTSLYIQRVKQTDSLMKLVCAGTGTGSGVQSALPEDTTAATGIPMLKTKLARLAKRKGFCRILARQSNRILHDPAGSATVAGNLYCKAIALCYDPHTEFFPLTEKEDFESRLGKRPFRFGFRIKEDKEGIFIEDLQPGSPAYKSGQLTKGDKIVQVQWAGKQSVGINPVNVEDLDDVLDMSNHDTLLLSVKKTDGSTTRVPLIKEQQTEDEDDDKVKSFVLKGAATAGYIYLPSFYEDWEGDNGLKGCANDVAREIVKLKKENIEGLILDLRYNGGGSVQEATELAGIFIDAGPVAQLKTQEPKPFTLNDVNRGSVYSGPLVVLVNGFSASASELLAAALQDYNRAVIVGATTYGKATGQIMFPMDTTITPEKARTIQTGNFIKITASKLYRINGSSIQATGVVPSVIVKDSLVTQLPREADEPFALKATTIQPNKYYKPYPLLPVTSAQTLDAAFKKKPEYTITNHQKEMELLTPGSYASLLNEAFKATLMKDNGLVAAYEVLLTLNHKQP